jgi:hypothetical protein
MVMTASTLYEAVEPRTVWKQLLNSVVLEIIGKASQVEVRNLQNFLKLVEGYMFAQAIRMVKFILGTFHVQDEEIQTIHLPIVFAAISETIRVSRVYISMRPFNLEHKQVYVEEDPSRACFASVKEALILQEEILRHVPPDALKRRRLYSGENNEPRFKQGSLAFACTFYELGDFPLRPMTEQRSDFSFVSIFEDLAALSTICANDLLDPSADASSLREVFCQTVLLIKALLSRMDQRFDSPFVTHWEPAHWLSVVIKCSEQQVCCVLLCRESQFNCLLEINFYDG